MKVYYQYSTNKVLPHTKGDFINELNMIDALRRFATVYYSGVKVDWDAPNHGMKEYAGLPENNVPQDCDLYYVRANKEVFNRIPKNRCKLWMASPFDEDCYRAADAIVTFSEAWARGLREATPFGWIPPSGHVPRPHAVNMDQVVADRFVPQNNYQVRKIRRSTGGNFVIGHFGRIVKSNYPFAFLRAWPQLIKTHPGIRLLVGSTRGKLPDGIPHVIQTTFPHESIPRAISACDLIVMSNWGPEWDICGSGKAIEAAACGVPLLLGRSPGREELLGKDYELFLPPLGGKPADKIDAKRIFDAVDSVIKNPDRLKSIGSKLPARAEFYHTGAAVPRLDALFNRLIKEKAHEVGHAS